MWNFAPIVSLLIELECVNLSLKNKVIALYSPWYAWFLFSSLFLVKYG